MRTQLLILVALLFAAPASAAERRPNFVLILVDDMGYAGVSCFGNPYFNTPEIDRLAAGGIRLTDFHSSGTVCSPTRAGLLTGRYQQRAGIEAVIHPVAEPEITATMLAKLKAWYADARASAPAQTGGWPDDPSTLRKTP